MSRLILAARVVIALSPLFILALTSNVLAHGARPAQLRPVDRPVDAPAATNTTYRWHNLQPGTYWADCHGGRIMVSWWNSAEVMVWCNNSAYPGNPYVLNTSLKLFRGDSGQFRGVLGTYFSRVDASINNGMTAKIVLSR